MSSLEVDIYDWTSRGLLQLIVVQPVVQWFATRRRARSARARRAWRLAWPSCEHELFKVVFACAWTLEVGRGHDHWLWGGWGEHYG